MSLTLQKSFNIAKSVTQFHRVNQICSKNCLVQLVKYQHDKPSVDETKLKSEEQKPPEYHSVPVITSNLIKSIFSIRAVNFLVFALIFAVKICDLTEKINSPILYAKKMF